MVYFTVLLSIFLSSSIVWAAEGDMQQHKAKMKQKMKAHHQEMQNEAKDFRATLEKKTKEEKKIAIHEHKNEKFDEHMAKWKQMHDEKLTKMKERLAGNSKLTQAQKDELISTYEAQYQKRVAHRTSQFTENQEFLSKLANDTNLTQEQRKAAIKAHFDEKK